MYKRQVDAMGMNTKYCCNEIDVVLLLLNLFDWNSKHQYKYQCVRAIQYIFCDALIQNKKYQFYVEDQ